MFYVIIKGKYETTKIPYENKEQAEAGMGRAKRKIAFAHCDISIVEAL